jgi:hypothetical protein
MRGRLTLPTDRVELTRIIREHVIREQNRLSYRRIMWLLAYYYLNGMRRFDVFDPRSGTLSPQWLDEDGNMEFQSQEMLSAVDRASARIASMDLRPKVEREGTSLRMIRERASAQLLLDAAISGNQLDQVKTQFAHLLVTLGTVGIAGHLSDLPTVGMTADLEVIHPKELFPFPSLGNDYTRAEGLVRSRIVPLSHLKERFGRKIARNLDLMEYWRVDHGDPIQDIEEEHDPAIPRNPFTGGSAEPRSMSVDGGEQDQLVLVRVRELWLDGDRGTCSRYVICSGEYVIEDQDLSGAEKYCPIGVARFIENGRFHGAGLFDMLFSMNREMERMLKALFRNVRDMDRYGIVVLPQGSFNERAILRDVGRGLRMVSYQPDPLNEKFTPFVIKPHDAGDIPGRTAQFAKELMDGINPIRDLLAEKGRVDSATGLQFLDEQISQAMTTPTRGVQSAFGQCYRSLAAEAAARVIQMPRAIPITHLNLDLAGAVIDPEEGTASFPENPIPHVGHLNFTVRETSPRSVTARKAEALELLKMQVTDPESFKLLALEEGLDFAMWMKEEQAAYETIVLQILTLYGNGDQSKQIVVAPHMARPDLQLRVLNAFMSSPQMMLAAPEVQDDFRAFRDTLMRFSGLVLPEAVPDPMDLAALGMGPPEPMNGQPGAGSAVASGAFAGAPPG